MVNFHAPLNAAASHLAYPLSPFTWVTDRSLEVHLKKKKEQQDWGDTSCAVYGQVRRDGAVRKKRFEIMILLFSKSWSVNV